MDRMKQPVTDLEHVSWHVGNASTFTVKADGEVLLVLLGAREPAVALGQVEAVLEGLEDLGLPVDVVTDAIW